MSAERAVETEATSCGRCSVRHESAPCPAAPPKSELDLIESLRRDLARLEREIADLREKVAAHAKRLGVLEDLVAQRRGTDPIDERELGEAALG